MTPTDRIERAFSELDKRVAVMNEQKLGQTDRRELEQAIRAGDIEVRREYHGSLEQIRNDIASLVSSFKESSKDVREALSQERQIEFANFEKHFTVLVETKLREKPWYVAHGPTIVVGVLFVVALITRNPAVMGLVGG